jgi:hypothetical protein
VIIKSAIMNNYIQVAKMREISQKGRRRLSTNSTILMLTIIIKQGFYKIRRKKPLLVEMDSQRA